MPKRYAVSMDTEEMAPHIVAVEVTIKRHVERNVKANFRVDLCEDPLYPHLCEYVANNPPRVKAKSPADIITRPISGELEPGTTAEELALATSIRDIAAATFDQVIMGDACAISQFGVPYSELLNGYFHRAGELSHAPEFIDAAYVIARHHAAFRAAVASGHNVIVWRIMPECHRWLKAYSEASGNPPHNKNWLVGAWCSYMRFHTMRQDAPGDHGQGERMK